MQRHSAKSSMLTAPLPILFKTHSTTTVLWELFGVMLGVTRHQRTNSTNRTFIKRAKAKKVHWKLDN